MPISFLRFPIILIILSFSISLYSQEAEETADAFFIKAIYDQVLTSSSCYDWLDHLSTNIGGRLSGSEAAAKAVDYTKQMLDTLGLSRVHLQDCMVPHWERGKPEVVYMTNKRTGIRTNLNVLALGNSIATTSAGISGEVVEVRSLDDLEKLGEAGLKGKVVFFNRPMDPTQIRTFNAYGGAVDQRVYGPTKASKYGAVGALVRSMTTKIDDIPHTGVTVYEEGSVKIPAVAISTMNAEMLSSSLKEGAVEVYIKTDCKTYEDKPSHNVIGEIIGSEFPEEIILVGGHLDSWDVGGGAHDDGAGCVHAMEVLNILTKLNYRPKRTLRCVLFMNEENGLGGGKAYAEKSNKNKEYHLAAIESDAGGFTPRGFSADGHADIFTKRYKNVTKWLPLLEPFGLSFSKGGSGADISPLKGQKGMLFGFRPDSQRYFDYHHTGVDTIDAVNQRELELGAAAITSLVYLIDKYGL
mgnify:CR=1 FL=1